ncbi:MAG: glycosyltransferase, partial [Candidatus Heimdallarchaeota archaeon]|nr:glycosyltransferase [Candidatus Heimdallarchaeota archaeon]
TLRLDVALFELVSAARILKDKQLLPNLKILIVGDGPFYQQLLKKVEDEDLSDIISIIGRVKREEAMYYLRASDLSYILFTIKGMNTKIGMPWKLYESLLNETYVLTMAGTYAAHFAKKYNVGHSVASTAPSDIASSIIKIYKQKDQDAFNLQQKFVWEVQEAEIIKTYLELIQENKS